MFLLRFGVGVVAVLGVFVFSLLLSGFVCSVFCLFGRFGLFWGGLLFCLGYCLFVCLWGVGCFVFVLGSFLFLFGWVVSWFLFVCLGGVVWGFGVVVVFFCFFVFCLFVVAFFFFFFFLFCCFFWGGVGGGGEAVVCLLACLLFIPIDRTHDASSVRSPLKGPKDMLTLNQQFCTLVFHCSRGLAADGPNIVTRHIR